MASALLQARLAAARGELPGAVARLNDAAPPADEDLWCDTFRDLGLPPSDLPATQRAAHLLYCEDDLPRVADVPDPLLRAAADRVFRTRHRDVALPWLVEAGERFSPGTAHWCEVRLDEAITRWRQRDRDTARQLYAALADACIEHPHVHVRTLYALMTRSLGSDNARALALAEEILERYPDRTHADDALYFATRAAPERLQAAARIAHERFPDGDLVGRLQLEAVAALPDAEAVALLGSLIESPWRDPAYETAGRLEFEAARRAWPDAVRACGYIRLLHERYPHTWTAEVAERDARFASCGRARPGPAAPTLAVTVTDPERAEITRRLMRLGAWRAAAEIWESIETPSDDERWLAAGLRYRAGQAREAHLPTRWQLYGWERGEPWGGARWRIAWPDPYRTEIAGAAEATGVPPSLIVAVMREESAFRERVRSFAGATGLMQVMPATAAEHRRGTDPDIHFGEPATNIRIGANVLEGLLGRWPGDVMRVAVGYNAGPGRVREWDRRFPGYEPVDWMDAIPFPEAWHYSRRVMQSERIYRHLRSGPPAP